MTTVKPLNTGLSAKPSPPPPPSPSFVPKPIASKEGTAIAQTSTSVVSTKWLKVGYFLLLNALNEILMCILAVDFYSQEMLENVKKCKNFLATLIKLASSGPQAPEMGQNVKNLVQSLLVSVLVRVLFAYIIKMSSQKLFQWDFICAKELQLKLSATI